MIPEEDRVFTVDLILEANRSGARLKKACEVLDISVSTFDRWRKGNIQDRRKNAPKSIPRKLTEEEKNLIEKYCCNPEFVDKNPYEIHATLLDRGIYIASISSFYRVLRERNLIKHRRSSRPGQSRKRPPQRKATGPNQVWCWDITWLKTDIRGIYYYAYVIIDIWDRSIVKWTIHDREDEALSRELFELSLKENGYPKVDIHSDNGNPMKGCTLLGLFDFLKLRYSFSRPRVSDDNPFIESFFKTVKYDIKYPKAFKAIESARNWFADFVHSYNTQHQHSGLHYMTPAEVRSGKYQSIIKRRNETMLAAHDRNPQRWSSHVKQLPPEHMVVLNPAGLDSCTAGKVSQAA